MSDNPEALPKPKQHAPLYPDESRADQYAAGRYVDGWNACHAAFTAALAQQAATPAEVCFTGLDDTAEQQRNRLAAERAYIKSHCGLAYAPVGSRDWVLFWGGWQDALAAVRQAAAPTGDDQALQRVARWLDGLPEKLCDHPYWTNGMFANDCRDAAEVARQAATPAQTRGQKLTEAGFTRRPTWRALPSDDEPATPAAQPAEDVVQRLMGLTDRFASACVQRGVAARAGGATEVAAQNLVTIRTALESALRAALAQAVPAGWRLVPEEPTQAMHDAGRALLASGAVPLEKVYRAMLAAQEKPE